MQVLESTLDTIPGPRARTHGARVRAAVAAGIGACRHGRAAWAEALEDGLLGEEIHEVLAGRRMVDAFPVRFGENPQAYATRAVAEMMVAYLR